MSSQIAFAHTNTIAYSALKIACFLVQSRMQIISTNAFEVFSTNWAIQCHIASFELKGGGYIGFRELGIFTGNIEVFKIWKFKTIYPSFCWFLIKIIFDLINWTWFLLTDMACKNASIQMYVIYQCATVSIWEDNRKINAHYFTFLIVVKSKGPTNGRYFS